MLGFQKQGWFGKQLNENVGKLLDGDYSRIPWVFCSLTEGHQPSKLRAAAALNKILHRLQFDAILKVDTQMRQTTSMEWSIDWRRVEIEEFFMRAMSQDLRRAVIIFSSFHPNGYLREKAVRMMGEYPSTLPFIILRQNDWVLEVRQAAELAFNLRMKHLEPQELLDALPFAEKLKGRKYGDSAQVFFNYLTSPENRADLINGLKSPLIRTRRLCVHALLDSPNVDTALTLEQLGREPDPFLRRIIFERLSALGEAMNEYAYIFLRDKYPPNRVLALRYLYTGNPNVSVGLDIAINKLLDKNADVRRLAREIVAEHNPAIDFADYYHSNLGQAVAPALLGLGETGQHSDCEAIEAYLKSMRSNVVAAAISALMRLDCAQYADAALGLLNHQSVGVVKTAQRLIMKHHVANYTQVKALFDETPFIHLKVKCATILFDAPKWQKIAYLLQILSCEDEQIRGMTMQEIYRWLHSFNRSYYQATLEQREMIEQLISDLGSLLPNPLVRELLFVIK